MVVVGVELGWLQCHSLDLSCKLRFGRFSARLNSKTGPSVAILNSILSIFLSINPVCIDWKINLQRNILNRLNLVFTIFKIVFWENISFVRRTIWSCVANTQDEGHVSVHVHVHAHVPHTGTHVHTSFTFLKTFYIWSIFNTELFLIIKYV